MHALAARGEDVLVNPAVFDLRGELDARVFQAAWAAVIARHPALRTAFAWEGLRRPMQVVRESVEADWRIDDWRGQSPAEQEAAWATWMHADAQRGFTLTQAPLMRFYLTQVGDHVSWRFAWISHHLILDRWCIDIVLGELRAFYEALSLDRDPKLPAGAALQGRRGLDAAPRPRAGRDVLAGVAARRRRAPGHRGRARPRAAARRLRDRHPAPARRDGRGCAPRGALPRQPGEHVLHRAGRDRAGGAGRPRRRHRRADGQRP